MGQGERESNNTTTSLLTACLLLSVHYSKFLYTFHPHRLDQRVNTVRARFESRRLNALTALVKSNSVPAPRALGPAPCCTAHPPSLSTSSKNYLLIDTNT